MSDKTNHPAFGKARKQPAVQLPYFTYATAPARLTELSGVPITERQLKRWVEAGRVDITKPGTRVYFTEAQLQKLADSFVIEAVVR